MNPSERIRIKTAIVQALASESWSVVDLTLQEFGLQTYDDFRGGADAYIIDVLRKAKDETLHGLALHLGVGGLDPESAPTEGLPSFWKPGHFRLFISHHHIDKERSGRLRDALAPFFVSGFVAHEDIDPAEEWQREIESALRTMDAMTTIHRPEFRTSVWTDQEAGWALGRRKLVIPLRFMSDPHGFLAKHQAVSIRAGHSTPEEVATQIYDTLRRNALTRERMLDALVARFEQATSFAAAARFLEPIEQNEIVSPELLDRIRKAFDANLQIRDSIGVTDRIRVLLAKHGYQGPRIPTQVNDDDVPF